MKVSVLATLIVIPMIASISLYCYAFISKRWSYLNEDLIEQHKIDGQQHLQVYKTPPNNIQLEMQKIRHVFRSHFSLFGYCLEYKWIYLLTIKPSTINPYRLRTYSRLFCHSCNQSLLLCPETECCMKRCDNIPDCPSYIDEKNCNRAFNQTRYYSHEDNCMWQSTWIGNQAWPSYSSLYDDSPEHFHTYLKRIRYYIMFLLFVAAPLLTLLALLIMFCINCIERFYSIPFAFVSFFSLASFLSGAGGLGIFLYEWIQDRLHRPDFAYEFGQTEALVIALNPWLIDVETLGLAFWLTVAAIATTLFTTILSCCFCCGLQSEKSKLRFHINNDVYEIVQMPPYDE